MLSDGCKPLAALARALCWPRAKSAGANGSPCSQPSPCGIPPVPRCIPPAVGRGLAIKHALDGQQLRSNLPQFAEEGCSRNAVVGAAPIERHYHGIRSPVQCGPDRGDHSICPRPRLECILERTCSLVERGSPGLGQCAGDEAAKGVPGRYPQYSAIRLPVSPMNMTEWLRLHSLTPLHTSRM